MPLNPGQILNNRYRIVSMLGKGGFGAIYRAWDMNLNRPCAVKENMDASPEAQKQFGREATLLAELAHPNLVRVIDYFFLPGQGQYFVMDFVEGQDLQQMLDASGTLPLEKVLPWIMQVCEALEYLHTQEPPVIHRDIKPANIKINPKNRAVLVDFGIAKIYDATLRTTQGARAITPGFSPPEQYGQGKTDTRSDQYALAATLYACLTGIHPPDSVDVMSGSLPPPPPAATANPNIPEGLSHVLEHAMRLNRAERYHSIAEFKTALAEHLPATVRIPDEPSIHPLSAQPTVMTPPVEVSIESSTAPSLAVTPEIIPPKPALKSKRSSWLWIAGGIGLFIICILVAVGGYIISQGGIAERAVNTEAPEAVIIPTRTPRPEISSVPEATSASENTPIPTSTPGTPVTISIWHQWSGNYLAAIQAVFDAYMAEHPNVTIILEHPDNVIDALAVAIPAGEGPDIIGWANDQIGALALAGNIVDLGTLGVDQDYLESNFEPAAVAGVVWQDHIWALPESQEGIAIVYNTALAGPEDFPRNPFDFQGLLQSAADYYNRTGRYLLCNQGLGNPDPYHVAPIYFGFGVNGYVDDTGAVHMNSPEALAAGNWMTQYHAFAPGETSHDICKAMITEGNAAAWWTGPWAIADLEAAGIDYGILPMGSPFVGIKVLMITSNAVDRGSAETALDVLQFFTNAENATAMALANKTIPANTEALNDAEVQALETIAGFGASLNFGVPMSNSPYSAAQWGPVGDATMAIWTGAQTPEEALAAAQISIEEIIAGMK